MVGNVYGSFENLKVIFSEGVNLRVGVNKILLLSIVVGFLVCFLFFVKKKILYMEVIMILLFRLGKLFICVFF